MVCKKHVRCRCMVMKWLMQDAMHEYGKWQMQEWYVHYDAMKRCLCGAWYECIYGHERPKNHISLLARLGAQCPMYAVKKVIWTFRPLMTKDETNIQRVRDDMMQMHKSVTGGCTQHGNIHKIIIQQRHTWHLGYMHDSVQRKTKHIACLLRAPTLGT